MRRSRSGFCSAQRPVMPKLAMMPFAFRVSRIWYVKPASDPASKLKATIMRLGSPSRITCANPAVGRGVGVAVGVALATGVGEGLALGVAVPPGVDVALAVGEGDALRLGLGVRVAGGGGPRAPPAAAGGGGRGPR